MVDAAGEATRDLARTKEEILRVASEHFTRVGYYGARVDEIAGRATKRKIYYYFEGKDELYRAVLERAYRRVRASESGGSVQGAQQPQRSGTRQFEATLQALAAADADGLVVG